MKRTDKVSILGVEYKIIEDDSIINEGYDGLCCFYDKIIKIRPLENMLSGSDSDEAKRKRYNEVLRHEIIHAFFDESGMDNYSGDEVLVQWLAMQMPKILNSLLGVVV